MSKSSINLVKNGAIEKYGEKSTGISTDAGNRIVPGTDGGLYVGPDSTKLDASVAEATYATKTQLGTQTTMSLSGTTLTITSK